MHIEQLYRTEMDWCALVSHEAWRATLTYPEQPDEAQVLEDAEIVYAASMSEDVMPPIVVDERTSDNGKRSLLLTQIEALSAYVEVNAAIFVDVDGLKNTLIKLADSARNEVALGTAAVEVDVSAEVLP